MDVMAQIQISQMPDWALNTTEEEDLEEPPELRVASRQQFKRSIIHRPSAQSSLLTKAIQRQSDDDEDAAVHTTIISTTQRRRSMTSNVSFASTADLTSDTGFTSPSRTNTPSPPLPEMLQLHINSNNLMDKDATPREAPAPRKRCIQFACAAKPVPEQPTQSLHSSSLNKASPSQQQPQQPQQPRRSSIRFACPSRPAVCQEIAYQPPSSSKRTESPSTPRKSSSMSATRFSSSPSPARPGAVRRLSNKSLSMRPKFLRANSRDLANDSSQFHEFASGVSREDDWIRHNNESGVVRKLTISDTLLKENNFRRLADEADAEEAAELDDNEDCQDDDCDDDEDEDDHEEEEEDDEEEDDDSDGYYTDEETGFADSDEDDDDEGLDLWTPSLRTVVAQSSSLANTMRISPDEVQSDSSIAASSLPLSKPRRIRRQSDAPNLPDSTDFVCGTLDEDRPLEEAYLSCLTARRNEKLRIIPQDIDPSFPTSEPEDEAEEYHSAHHGSDEGGMMHGEMEDIHHGDERSRRRRKSEQASPRKYHSPPPRRNRSPAPKRHASPAPRARCRSPTRLFDRRSPRRMRSPAPRAFTTPLQSPRQGANVKFQLAGRPGMTQTKSLPRPSAMMAGMKHGRCQKHHRGNDVHIRGAVDIVKGLEEKRQRRTEKFYQKYCNRARRGQIPERKPQPGRGAERMKELGLLMAGKKEQGNYVLSI